MTVTHQLTRPPRWMSSVQLLLLGHVMGYQSNSRTELGAEGSFQQRHFQPRARDILISWTRAREYRDGEARYLQIAHSSSDPGLRDRFVAIAQHYRSLAKIEQSIADQRPNKKVGA